jgi:hypothetical protein
MSPPVTAHIKVLEFLGSALDAGWTVKKSHDAYVFTKAHEGKKQVFTDEYLAAFVEKHLASHEAVGSIGH